MDLVEFKIAIEKRFDVRIADEDAAQITTPRKLIDYLAGRLCCSNDSGPCLTQRGFYCVRQALVSRLGTPRELVRASANLAALVPPEDRPQRWALLQAATNARCWPPLYRPRWLFWSLFGCSVAAAIAALVAPIEFWGTWPAILAAASTWILVGMLLARATVSWKTEFPDGVVVGDLARFLLAYTPIEGDNFHWTRAQVASVVHALIVLDLGVREYTEDSRWLEDMGLDD